MADDKSPVPISAVGEIRGFFEVFLPGLFVLLHFVLAVYCLSPSRSDAQDFLLKLATSSTTA
jgi:hypothetical protein